MIKLKLLFSFSFVFCALMGYAQKGTISGMVSDDSGPLIGVSISIDGTTIGTITDLDGRYAIDIDAGTYTLSASYVGYNSTSKSVTVSAGQNRTVNFSLSEGVMVDEIVVLGSRATARTNLESAVPVDVINVTKLTAAAPQTNLNQILHFTAPSFSSNTQTISDGTDHVDPASLRGLGPDQVLVLVNGKRRHTSSLVNVNGTFGRGNVGTDLNAIPASAVQNIEILRDGAAAQYGSDAIAGVINLKLKEAVNELTFNITTGANFTSNIGPFGGEEPSVDGEVVNVGVNYGLPLGDKGGFINMTGEFNYRNRTNRMQEFSGQIFNGYNGVERVAMNAGADVSSLSLTEVQQYAQGVSYFSSELKQQINDLSDLSGLSGLLNFDATTDELAARGMQRSDFNLLFGQSRVRGGQSFVNMELPVGENLELYAFGGLGYRTGQSGCFYRLPAQNRTTTAIYPNGTVPRINSNITDQSLGMGIRGMIGNWNVDFSNVFGSNTFNYYISETHNATLGPSSPTAFNAGGHTFNQSTGNLDISQYFEEVGSLKGINLAFGSEYRYENYNIDPGSEQSYGNYDINGNLVNPATPDELMVTDYFGRARPAGAQCFAGFLPTNVVDARRSSVAGYVDAEFDFSDAFLLATAIRYENYSDFGSTFNYKAAARYKVNENLALRAATSTGFRAPSLHQIHFSRTSTIFSLVDGVSVPQEVGTFANTSRAAQLLGIPELKEETSASFSAGFTAKIPSSNLRLTIDGYLVNIDDRVIFTGQFQPGDNVELQSIFEQAGATRAAFFANAISTQSQGIDVVVSHSMAFAGGSNLRNDFAATFTQTKWDQDEGINASPILEQAGLVETYFDRTSRIYLEQAVPRVKFTLSHTFNMDKLSVYLRNTYFGETTEATNAEIFDADLNWIDQSIDPYNTGKVLTDLSLSYKVDENLSLTVGANNLLDIYPDEADPSFQSSGRFVYSRRSPQFSYSGRHLFARLIFNLK